MRKILFTIFSLLSILIIWDGINQDAHSNVGGSPGGYSGSPADGNRTCGNCHGGNANPATQPGIIASNIPVAGYTPGSVYTLTLTADHLGKVKYGFELSASNSGGTSLGGFIHTTSFTRAVITKNATHTTAGTAAPSGSRTWTLDWTAPASGTGTVTFYMTLNATNSSGGSSGDIILKSTLSISEKIEPCQLNELTVSANNSTICPNASTFISVFNTEPGISYELKNAGTNATIGLAQSGNGGTLSFSTGNLSSATTFKILATKDLTCDKTMTSQPTVTLFNDPIPTISADGPLSFCIGDSVVLTSSAAQSYSWSTGQTSSSITVKNAGNYSVTATYTNGCTRSSGITAVTTNPLPAPTVTPKGAISLCSGDSLTLSTGVFANYTWSNGKTTRDVVIKTAGNYSVQVVNQFGCVGKSLDTAFVTLKPKPSALITVTDNAFFCDGDSVILSVPAGNNYQWSNGSTSNAITVKTTGNFSVSVESGGCTSKSDTIKTELKTVVNPVLNYSGNVALCQGSTITLSLSSPYSSYLWSTGETSPTITVGNSGSYSVQVGNAFGCKKTSATVTVSSGAELRPLIQPSGPTVLCPGESVIFSVGSFDNYLWSNGVTDSALTVTQAGAYSVFVSNQSGCSGRSDTIIVLSEASPIVSMVTNGLITGCDSVYLEATSGNYTYLWNTGETVNPIYSSQNGFHFVTVTSPAGCKTRSDSALTVVGQTPNASISFFGGVFTSSESERNQWYRGAALLVGETNSTLQLGSEDGDYYTVVTDETGLCKDTSNVININRTSIQVVDEPLIKLYPNPANDKLLVSYAGIAPTQLVIYNLLGAEIATFSNRISPIVVDISSLGEGPYLLSIIFPHSVVIKPFSVQKND